MIDNETGVSHTLTSILILLILFVLAAVAGHMAIPLFAVIVSPTLIIFGIYYLQNQKANRNKSIAMIVVGISLISCVLILTYLERFDWELDIIMLFLTLYSIIPLIGLGIGIYLKKTRVPVDPERRRTFSIWHQKKETKATP